jgi:protein gp37
MENSKIEWTHHTANLWHGCMEVHEGCDNCYARVLNNRYHKENPHWGGKVPRLIIKKTFQDLAKYQKNAAELNEVHRVFVGSMMDIFEKPMPLVDGKGLLYKRIDTSVLREELFANISLGFYPNLLFLLLTKRPSNINKYIPESWKINGAPDNVMFGTSVVNQQTADSMIPELLKVKGKRFLSMEPLLGPVDIYAAVDDAIKQRYGTPKGFSLCGNEIHWVIAGGESGHGARPMHPDWARSLRDQCKYAGVPFFFKQWGEYSHGVNARVDIKRMVFVLNDGRIISGDEMIPRGFHSELMARVGKSASGSLLDGKEYKAFP